jgi:hypothetical protein
VAANVRDGVLVADPKTLEERRKVAREFAAQFKVTLPVLVDTLDDQVERAYAGWPDRIYVIDAEGKIAYKGGPGPQGFSVPEARAALDRLLAGQPAPPARPGQAPAELPPMLRERLQMMLGRLGMNEAETAACLRAASERMRAFAPVQQARRGLLEASRTPGAAEAALAAYQDALKGFTAAAERLDRELDAAVKFSERPDRKAALTALALIGAAPAAPLAGPLLGERPGGPLRPGR